MTYIHYLGGIAFVSALPAAALAQSAASPMKQSAALVDASIAADGPGATVVVTRRGKVVYSGARGFADLETRKRMTLDTPVRLGSITKQFTAAMVLQLVAEDKLSLDDPISRFFPDFPAPGARATVRQLLNHSSGLMDFTKIPGWMMGEQSLRPNTTADLVALIAGRPAVSEPGTRWEYNNGGYVMLGAIIEKLTGMAWHEAVVERIARPLGLHTIRYAGADDRVRGYSLRDGEYAQARGVHISVAHAAGGLVGSASDLAKWARALHHGRVVTGQLYIEMTTPMRLNDGSSQPYGFGLRVRKIRGRKAFVHGGAGRGLDTDSVYIPSDDVFVAVLSNTDDPKTDPSILTRRLAALAVGQPIPSLARVEVSPASIEALFGIYANDEGPPRRFFTRDGKIFVGLEAEEMEVVAAGNDRFFVADDSTTSFKITRQADGRHMLEIDRADAAVPVRAVRTGDVPPPFAVAVAVLKSYAGTYQTEGPELVVSLDMNGRLAIGPSGQEPQTLRPISNTEFRFEGGPMRIVFHPEGDKTDRLTLYRGARELHGKRVAE
jgi:D-alanyl-D-alanine carboxypeptidase